MDDYIRINELDWSRCVGVCWDGAAAMTRRNSGVTAVIVFTDCMLHCKALVAKQNKDELNQVLQDIIQAVNFIKTHPLKHRLFALLYNKMGACFDGLLLCSIIPWLSQGAVLNSVYEMQREVGEFLLLKNICWQTSFTT